MALRALAAKAFRHMRELANGAKGLRMTMDVSKHEGGGPWVTINGRPRPHLSRLAVRIALLGSTGLLSAHGPGCAPTREPLPEWLDLRVSAALVRAKGPGVARVVDLARRPFQRTGVPAVAARMLRTCTKRFMFVDISVSEGYEEHWTLGRLGPESLDLGLPTFCAGLEGDRLKIVSNVLPTVKFPSTGRFMLHRAWLVDDDGATQALYFCDVALAALDCPPQGVLRVARPCTIKALRSPLRGHKLR